MNPAAVACIAVSVEYGPVRALDSIDLRLSSGEVLALLGPSGSGKTTLLYAIAGFVPISAGEVLIGGRSVSTPGKSAPPETRRVGMVFQNYALWSHLSALDTVAYPIRRSGHSRADARRLAAGHLQQVGMADLEARRPAELSGGQQQRVGLARALARQADVYLFDEPTAHLDATVRRAVQAEVARRRAEVGAAAIYSTHDAAEALSIADRVAILRSGRLVQEGKPRQVYERPVDIWTARLTGPASTLRGEVKRADGEGLEVSIDGHLVSAMWDGSADRNRPVDIVVRPDWVVMEGPLTGTVREVWYRGPYTDYQVETSAGLLEARIPGPPQMSPGDRSGWSITKGWIMAEATP